MVRRHIRLGFAVLLLACALVALFIAGDRMLSPVSAQQVIPGNNVNMAVGSIGMTSNDFLRLSIFNPTNEPMRVLLSFRTFANGMLLKSSEATLMPGTGTSLDLGDSADEACPAGARCEVIGFIRTQSPGQRNGLGSLQLIDRTTRRTTVVEVMREVSD